MLSRWGTGREVAGRFPHKGGTAWVAVCSMNRRQGEEGVQRYSRERPRQEQDWSVQRTAGRGGWGYSDTGGGKGVPGGGTA